MKKLISIFTISLITLYLGGDIFSRNVQGEGNGARKSSAVSRTGAAGCLPAKSSNEVNINNVRARINTGGDMWWDLQGIAQYEIPKGSTKTAMFSASLWLGGTDVNGQLKGAFQRYRGSGNDYWPGPLTTDGKASITSEVCDEYDKIFVITREEVDAFILKFNNPEYPDYVVPDIIKNWPANGDVSKGQSQWLAPFFDQNNDDVYDWTQGDYPYYDIDNTLCKPTKNSNNEYYYEPTQEGGILADAVLKGDQTLWWVFNDNGNIHSETKGTAIGVEIRAQAFAFSTNDEINNMTFYTYEIINRSTFRLTNTYFSQWVDTDLGYANDDYVGCDVERGLGYCYNGSAIDGLGKPEHYGVQPPAVGVDFFQGPYMDPDNKDNPKYDPNGVQYCDESINGVNFGDSIKDNERFGMRRFVYHNNPPFGTSATQDPQLAPEYYQMLKGIWKDGTKMTYGDDAYNTGGPVCDFMFPAKTDPCNWGTGGVDPNFPGSIGWTEETSNNAPGDRRFMQSAGEFTLESGAINYITVGIPFARASSGGPFASVELLRKVDDKAQALFDNCFKVLDGPDAPEVIAQELDRTIIIYLKNIKASNNAHEDYTEEDVTISALNDDTTNYDAYYHFQGYQIYQLANDEVSLADLNDPDKSRIVAQCDLKDSIENLVNFTKDDKLNGNVPQLMVEAENTGIRHSFKITEDKFASGDTRLINNKKYYFVAIAYSQNNYLQYSQDAGVINGLNGQKKPYLAGRKSAIGAIKVHTLMPHLSNPEGSGTVVNSEYGSGPRITRLDGRGNGGMYLEFTSETKKRILAENQVENVEYENGFGPINVKVIDPLNVENADYILKFTPPPAGAPYSIDTASWVLYKNGDSLTSSFATIELGDEQLLLDEGLSIQIIQNKGAGDITSLANGVISATISYEDVAHLWLSGFPDIDGASDLNRTTPSPYNWIRSGSVDDATDAFHNDYMFNDEWLDPAENYEKLLSGTWAPYRMASIYANGPAGTPTHSSYKLSICESVDVVFTSDKSKWTRCPVIETGDDAVVSEGNRKKFQLRASQSIDKDGKYATAGSGNELSNEELANYISETGMGWFPGYAISVESGERLNVMYGESSWLVGENGRDMQFNPTSNFMTNIYDVNGVLMGGKHFLYIFRHSPEINSNGASPAYDKGKWLHEILSLNNNSPSSITLMQIHRDIMWVSIPMAIQGEEWLPKDNDAVVRLRVDFPYQNGVWSNQNPVNPDPGYNASYPAYQFNTGNIATTLGDLPTAESALDLIRAVPNPYYAFSSYETDQIDNRVRITNLPERCDISIYSTNGVLVRRFKKDETNTFLDWDLKNSANIPIASGVYYIHINAPNIGEKVIKWFGVLRPIDLNAF